ncbi:MAG TPA: rubredoxin [Methanoregulaceae archaeon]|nr:rubredoxin [Methanoregulaceae archaeon]HPD74879.1 rubredoxin [Methanoregulaceae archaeon]
MPKAVSKGKRLLKTAGTKKIPARKAASLKTKTSTRSVAAKKKAAPKKKTGSPPSLVRYKCRVCGYVYSPIRGEPHNGIPKGTAFEDLPDTYVCPVCGFQGKGKVGKWGFDEWRPTRYVCSICGYVYDEKRGEPHRGIRPGTKFEDLPDDYRCPVCFLDPKITKSFGKVRKQGFEPLDV